MTFTVLYPCDPLAPRRVDPHFAVEADAARELGATVAPLDHDTLLAGDADEAVRGVPRGAGPVWYRGWMVPSDRYAALDQALRARDASTCVAPEDYRRAHELPGWYEELRAVTPRSVWLAMGPGAPPDPERLAELVRPLGSGPGVVKDFVKSRKHEWHEACLVPDLADIPALHRVVRRFVELQDDSLAGGIVVRTFEEFDPTAGETRVWWVGDRPVWVGPHPDTPEAGADPDLDAIAPLVRRLGHPFVTTDLARRTDGVWRVVEVGDGQVSDRPAAVPAEVVLSALRERAGTDRDDHGPQTTDSPETARSARGAPIRVVIADDEHMVRAGLVAVLTANPGLEVVGEAADGAAAVDLVREHRPDIALLDVQMPGTGGLAATETITAEYPETAVVILTTFSEDAYITRALSGGASGFVLKTGDPRELASGLRAVADGGAYLSPEVARRVIAELGSGGGGWSSRTAARDRVATLSGREREVLGLIGEGLSNEEIAGRLGIVPGTAKVHVGSILARLDVRNRVQAAIIAYEAGMVGDP